MDKHKWAITLDNVPTIAAWLVFALTIIAFALSFDALRDVANSNGKTAWRSIFWPVLIDGGLVIFSIAVLRANLLNERAWGRWGLVALATGLTIYFNLIHAETNVNARIVAVVPPVVLFFGFETLVGMLKSNARRARETTEQDNGSEQATQLREKVAELGALLDKAQDDAKQERGKVASFQDQAKKTQAEVGRLTSELAAMQESIGALQAQAAAAQAWHTLSATSKALWIAENSNGDRPPAEQLARVLEVNVSTIYKAYKKADEGK